MLCAIELFVEDHGCIPCTDNNYCCPVVLDLKMNPGNTGPSSLFLEISQDDMAGNSSMNTLLTNVCMRLCMRSNKCMIAIHVIVLLKSLSLVAVNYNYV